MRIVKHAMLWLIASIALSSCAGRPAQVLPPVVVATVVCPEPPVPALPPLDGSESFDSFSAWAVLMERDDSMRAYINGLRRTVRCYAAQAGIEPAGVHHAQPE